MRPPLGLYVHVPWCLRKCPYCDFNSHAAPDPLPEAAFLAAFARDLAADAPRVAGRPVETLFIGGGTPSLLSAEAVAGLLEEISRRITLTADSEITLEANPGTVEAGRFAAYRRAGVNRLSLGIQSFSDPALRALGRVHDGAQARQAVDQARAAGFERLNLDLMHGLPGQRMEDALADLHQAIALGPDQISWYQLTLEPNTAFHAHPPVLPDEETLSGIQDRGQALLEAAGFLQYEVSAFARAGGRCRHNLNYWRFGDYLGLGPGAHGKLTPPEGPVLRLAKHRHPKAWLEAKEGLVSSRWELGPEDLRAEFMLNALRLKEGFEVELYRRHTGRPPTDLTSGIEIAVERGMLDYDGSRLRPSALGWRFLDDLVALFF